MNIQIQTLSPVHIGNGLELQGDFEYLYFDAEKQVAIIDNEKILQLLGEENVSQWVACIEKGEPLMPLLESRRKSLKSTDVAFRSITCKKATHKPIREHINNGNASYLIPGSSLKGAIRTAVFAELILDNDALAKDQRNLGANNYRGGIHWSDKYLNRSLLGNDPNTDIFRLLQVGDATFGKTEIFQTDVINKYNNGWRLKQELTQFVEAIPAGATTNTTSKLHFNDLLRDRARNTFNRNSIDLEIANLFPLINQHTKRLLEDEINFWAELEDNPDVLGDYVEHMENILAVLDACSEKECVIRLGWGSGFRFMTGDWHGVMEKDDYELMVRSVRPKHPEDLIFPKTTRFIAGGIPLGFIKITLT